MQHMTGSNLSTNFVDKRRLLNGQNADDDSHVVGATFFTTNAGGTTTTAVGANADPSTNTNVVRIGDKFKLFTSGGVLKEEKVFTVTAVAPAGSTTVTFSPAAAVVTASGDILKLVGTNSYSDIDNLDRRLLAVAASTYTQAKLDQMPVNDKIYALRLLEDSSGI